MTPLGAFVAYAVLVGVIIFVLSDECPEGGLHEWGEPFGMTDIIACRKCGKVK